MKKVIVFALLVTASCAQAVAQVVVSDKDGWHKIAEKTVDFKTESDEIMVMGADKFASMKIKVTEAPVNLTSFDIYFEDGSKQSVAIGQEIKSPGETKTVQLTGGERSIKKVTFIYKTVANSMDKKAHLELWGKKTNADKKTK